MRKVAIRNGLYSIGTLAALTGVNPVTLRAWERRFGLLRPERGANGYRCYGEADVNRVREILALLAQGVAISRVDALLGKSGGATATPSGNDAWSGWRARMLIAIGAFDDAELERVTETALAMHAADAVTANLFLPLLAQLGERWSRGQVHVSEEHFFSMFIRNKLGARLHHRNLRVDGPALVAACLPGELHEFGLLFFSLLAQNHGFRTILLGPNLPLADLPHVAQTTRCAAVVLSGSADTIGQSLLHELRKLAQSIRVPVFCGGAIAQHCSTDLRAAGLIPTGSDIHRGMNLIARRIRREPSVQVD